MTSRLSWPADRFYWAVLDAPGVSRPGQLPTGLYPILDEEIPADTAELHAVCVPAADGKLAVCAIETIDLAEVPVDSLSLTPSELPAFVESLGVSAERFNLLSGSFEPRPLRSRRIRRHAFSALTVLLCVSLLAVGLHRRSLRWEARAESARIATSRVANLVTATGRVEDIRAEAARLEGTRDALAQASPPPDASLSLAALLESWPARVSSRPQSITVGPEGIAVSVAVEGDASAFLGAFSPPPGWTLAEPRLNASDTVTRLSLQLRPAGGKQ